MLKIFLVSIGILLVFEGLIYFIFAGNMIKFLEKISKLDPQLLKTISTLAIGLGFCLIYFTLRFYSDY